jgi:hypothetical protein
MLLFLVEQKGVEKKKRKRKLEKYIENECFDWLMHG